jgi:hypothetical protein
MTQTPNNQPPPEVPLGKNKISPAYDYSQGRDQRWAVKAITSNGACLGLSVFWIVQNANGKKFLPWLDPPRTASSRSTNKPILWEDPTLVEVQNVMKQQGETAAGFEDPEYLKRYKLSKVDAYSTIVARAGQAIKERAARLKTDGPPVQFLSKSLDSKLTNEFVKPAIIANEIIQKNCYGLLGFFGEFFSAAGQSFRVPRGGHAVAVWVDLPRVTFFDPNYGEYLFPDTASFVDAFEYLFDQQYMVACTSAFLQRFYMT